MGKLPDGTYTFKGHGADGRQMGGSLMASVPLNDPAFAVGVLCSNRGTAVVRATAASGTEFTTACR